LKRPRGIEKIRPAFSHEAVPQLYKLGQILTRPDNGMFDFGKLFDLLSGFFPKLANLKKFVGIFQRIREIAREVKG